MINLIDRNGLIVENFKTALLELIKTNKDDELQSLTSYGLIFSYIYIPIVWDKVFEEEPDEFSLTKREIENHKEFFDKLGYTKEVVDGKEKVILAIYLNKEDCINTLDGDDRFRIVKTKFINILDNRLIKGDYCDEVSLRIDDVSYEFRIGNKKLKELYKLERYLLNEAKKEHKMNTSGRK